MLKTGTVACVALLFLTAVAAQTQAPVEPPAKADDQAANQAAKVESGEELARLRQDVERLQRALQKQHEETERQIEGLKKAVEARIAGLVNGVEAVRISVDAVKNAVGSLQLPRRPPITVTADSAAPIVCGPAGCEATALDHCRKSGYDMAHVVHKLEKPVQWLYTFVCRDG